MEKSDIAGTLAVLSAICPLLAILVGQGSREAVAAGILFIVICSIFNVLGAYCAFTGNEIYSLGTNTGARGFLLEAGIFAIILLIFVAYLLGVSVWSPPTVWSVLCWMAGIALDITGAIIYWKR